MAATATEKALESMGAAVQATLDAVVSGAARLGSDLIDRELVPRGAIRWQLKSLAGPIAQDPDSNEAFVPAIVMELRVLYHLAIGQAERAWTEDLLQGVLESLLDPDYWSALVGIKQVDEAPETGLSDLTRDGDVVSVVITAQFSVDVDVSLP